MQLTLTGDFAGAAALYRDLLARAAADEKANAYLDLGTWWCLTPYIGAGLGSEHGIMTAAQAAGAGDAVGLEC